LNRDPSRTGRDLGHRGFWWLALVVPIALVCLPGLVLGASSSEAALSLFVHAPLAALPFVLLALVARSLARVRESARPLRHAAAAALAVAVAIHGSYFVAQHLERSPDDGGGAQRGAAMLVLASPFLVAAIALVVGFLALGAQAGSDDARRGR
jgi:hypothetical protein